VTIVQKPFYRNDLMDEAELSRALRVSVADIDRALIARRIPLPSTGAVPGLALWHRDEIHQWLARHAQPRYFAQG
jgi:hypothetical protein